MQRRRKIPGILLILAGAILIAAGCSQPIEDYSEEAGAPTHKPTNIVQVFSQRESIRLKWDNLSDRKEFIIYRSDTIDGSYHKVGYSFSNYFTNYQLTEATVYYYKVSYINTDGIESSKSSPFLAVTAIFIVTGFEVESFNIQTPEVNLAWHQHAQADGYRLYRESNESGNFELLTTITESTTLTYCDTTIEPDNSYRYKIFGYKELAGGVKSYSESSEVKKVTTMEGIPQGIEFTNILTESISITWSPVISASLELKGYMVYRADEFPELDSSYNLIATLNSIYSTEFTDTTLLGGREYYYKVSSYSLTKEYRSEYESIITPPPAAEGVTVDVLFITDTGVEVSWFPMQASANLVNGYFIYFRKVPFTDPDPSKPTITKYLADGSATKYRNDHQYSESSPPENLEPDTQYYVYVQPYIDTDITDNDPTTNENEVHKSLIGGTEGNPEMPGTSETLTKMSKYSFTSLTERINEVELLLDYEDTINNYYKYHIYRATDIQSAFDAGTIVATIYKDHSADSIIVEAGDSDHSADIINFGQDIEYINLNLPLGDTYYYRLRVERTMSLNGMNLNQSVLSDIQTAGAKLPDTTGMAAIGAGYTSITLQWDRVAGVPKYRIYRKLSSVSSYPATPLVEQAVSDITTSGLESYTDSTAAYRTEYDYIVYAINIDGSFEGEVGSEVTDTITAELTAPAGLTAATAEEREIDLSWPAVTGAAYYSITLVTSTETIIADNITALSYSVGTGLSPGEKYTFAVYAHIDSVIKSAAAMANGYTYPEVSTLNQPALINTDRDSFTLTWDAGLGTGLYYEIYRKPASAADYPGSPVDTTDGLTIDDRDLLGMTTYSYKVRSFITKDAADGGGNIYSRTYSEDQTADTGLGTPTVTLTEYSASIKVEWTAVDGALSYRVERSVDGGSFTILAGFSSGDTDGDASSDSSTYRYRVTAINGTLESYPGEAEGSPTS